MSDKWRVVKDERGLCLHLMRGSELKLNALPMFEKELDHIAATINVLDRLKIDLKNKALKWECFCHNGGLCGKCDARKWLDELDKLDG